MMGNNRVKLAARLIGRIDSAVTAVLLREKRYVVIGISMEIYAGRPPAKDAEKRAYYFAGEKEDIEAAESVCK